MQTQRLDEYFDLGRLLKGGTFDLGWLTLVSEEHLKNDANTCTFSLDLLLLWFEIQPSTRHSDFTAQHFRTLSGTKGYLFLLPPNLFSPFLEPSFLVRRFDWLLCLEAGMPRDRGCSFDG